jgi:hypothetical protein
MSHPRLPFIDSFDHESEVAGARKWTVNRAPITPNGRHGCGALLGGNCATFFATDYESMAAGCAYKTTSFQNAPLSLMGGWEGIGGSSPSSMAALYHLGDERLYVRVSGNVVAKYSAPSDFVMQLNTWYYLELKATITTAYDGICSVAYEVYVNEEIVLSGTIAGMAFTHGVMNGLALTGPGGGNTATFDDVYATAGVLLGDIRIGVIRPNGEGSHQDWAPDSGSAHFSRVNDLTPDDLTSYLSATEPGQKETHEYEDVTISGSAKAIQTLVCLKKSDAGSAGTKSLLRSGAGEEVNGEEFYPSEESWFYDRTGYLLNPWTGLAWTQAEINTLQFGLERTV